MQNTHSNPNQNPNSPAQALAFSGHEVKTCDFARLGHLLPEKLSPEMLGSLCHRVDIQVGAEGEFGPRLYADPYARRFIRQLHARWPYASFFSSLESPFVTHYLLSLVDHIQILEFDAPHIPTRMFYCIPEMHKCIAVACATIQAVGTCAGMTQRQTCQRQHAFHEYLSEFLDID